MEMSEYENLLKILKRRRSVRAYKEEDISNDDLNRLLKAAQFAPSAGNLQAREFIIVRDANAKHQLSEAALGQFFIAKAPIVLVGCANIGRSSRNYGDRGQLYAIQDVTIAASYIQLAAESMGLSTCWIGAFHEERVRELLELPLDIRPVLILPVGYPNETPMPTMRIDITRFTHRERWS
jgi:nitroreductase